MIKSRLEYGSLPSKSDEITIPSYLADMIINSDNTIVESENSIKSRSDLIGKRLMLLVANMSLVLLEYLTVMI